MAIKTTKTTKQFVYLALMMNRKRRKKNSIEGISIAHLGIRTNNYFNFNFLILGFVYPLLKYGLAIQIYS